MVKLLLSLLIGLLFTNFSHAEKDDHEGSSFGEGMAIIDVHDNGHRFKLSDKAIASLKLKHEAISSLDKGTYKISKNTLVSFGEEFGVFVVRDGWFELIEVEIKSRKKDFISISSKNLNKSDQIVVSGVPLLRVAQLEASGEGGEGHGH